MLTQRLDVPFKLYTFTPDEEMRAKLLPPLTLQYLEHAATEIAEELCNVEFSSDPIELASQIKSFISMKAHRDCLLGLLNDSQQAYTLVAASQSQQDTQPQPTGEFNVASF